MKQLQQRAQHKHAFCVIARYASSSAAPFWCLVVIIIKIPQGNLAFRKQTSELTRFANMVINDATFLIDESLASLKKIHDVELLMSKEEEWNALSEDERAMKEGTLEDAKKQVAVSIVLLGSLHLLTKWRIDDKQ